MAEPFVGEIRTFAFGQIPQGWAPCNGQLINVQTNQVLFSIIGATYGGDGRTTFALPNLQGGVPVHQGAAQGVPYGKSGGEAAHALTINEMPNHSHTVNASKSIANSGNPTGNVWSFSDQQTFASTANATMSLNAISTVGSSQPHNNMQPYSVLSFCIALTGLYPSRN